MLSTFCHIGRCPNKYAAIPPPACLEKETTGIDWFSKLVDEQAMIDEWHDSKIQAILGKLFTKSCWGRLVFGTSGTIERDRSPNSFRTCISTRHTTSYHWHCGYSSPNLSQPLVSEEDPLIKQLRKTKVDVSVWELLSTSKDHREALMNALTELSVSTDISPQVLVSFLTNDRSNRSIIFSDVDLPTEGASHNKALYLTVGCKGHNVPLTLVDTGSAVNVCPLRTALYLGLDPKKDFIASNQGIRAYDNSRRPICGTVQLHITTGPIQKLVEFHVVDIKPTFNLLLGRPWLHELGAVPSSLHQMVKLN